MPLLERWVELAASGFVVVAVISGLPVFRSRSEYSALRALSLSGHVRGPRGWLPENRVRQAPRATTFVRARPCAGSTGK